MRGQGVRGSLPTAGLAAGLFFLLSEGRAEAWWVGGPVVLLAVAARAWLTPPARGRLRLSALPGLAVAFGVGSLAGAIDVTRRVLDPRLPLDPALLRHRWRVKPGPGRTTLVALLNLTPGTVAAWAGTRTLRVHVVDRHRAPADIARWEDRVARLLTDEPHGRGAPRREGT